LVFEAVFAVTFFGFAVTFFGFAVLFLAFEVCFLDLDALCAFLPEVFVTVVLAVVVLPLVVTVVVALVSPDFVVTVFVAGGAALAVAIAGVAMIASAATELMSFFIKSSSFRQISAGEELLFPAKSQSRFIAIKACSWRFAECALPQVEAQARV